MAEYYEGRQFCQAKDACLKVPQQANHLNTTAKPPAPAGVMDLIETAHAAMEALQDSIAILRDVLFPVTIPESVGEPCNSIGLPSDAPAITALDALIARLYATRNDIIQLTKNTRI
jgi:hypothetical protein